MFAIFDGVVEKNRHQLDQFLLVSQDTNVARLVVNRDIFCERLRHDHIDRTTDNRIESNGLLKCCSIIIFEQTKHRIGEVL